jgi:hypothetical protein
VQVSEIRVDGDQVIGVATTDGPLNAAQVLVAAGPWGAALARRAGFAPAVQPIRHQRVRTGPAPGIPDHHPVVRVPDVGCYLRPEKGGYLYGFFEPDPTAIDPLPDDFTTSQLEPPVATITTAQRGLLPQFPVLADLDIAERIQGLTTFAPDGSYVLGGGRSMAVKVDAGGKPRCGPRSVRAGALRRTRRRPGLGARCQRAILRHLLRYSLKAQHTFRVLSALISELRFSLGNATRAPTPLRCDAPLYFLISTTC